MHLFIIN